MSERSLLRLAVAGCGQVFERYHLPALLRSRDWRAVAVSDPDPVRRGRAVAALPGATAFDVAVDMLSSTAPDAVLVSTPPATHPGIAVAALERGFHVLVEKPMALSSAEARRMAESAREAGKLLAVGFNRRFRRAESAMARLIRNAPAGSVQALRHEFLADAGRWHGAGAGRAASDLEDVLDDIACHGLDLLAWITGREIAAVRAVPRDEAAVEIEIRFDGALNGEIAASSIAGRSARHRERLEATIGGRGVLCLPGGVARRRGAPPGRLAEACLEARHAARLILGRIAGIPAPSQQSFEAQLAAFAGAVRAGGAGYPGATAASGLRVVLAVEACRASLEGGGSWKAVAREPESHPVSSMEPSNPGEGAARAPAR
jgi:predicted dehydrogenase